ncbi:hypothetical protein Gpo141_00004796 [Globisporangium polare]
MRSQSDGGIILIAGLPLAPISKQQSPLVKTAPAVTSELQSQQDTPSTDAPTIQAENNLNVPAPEVDMTSGGLPISPPEPASESENANACDVFLNASIQLLHSQSDARQRVRQLWFTIQRLRYESQLSDSGVELLHAELLAIMKSFNMEKQEGVRHLKAGYLTLVQAPDWNLRPPLLMKTLFGSDTGGGSSRPAGGAHQRMWCTLSEEYGKFEMTPVATSRDDSKNGSTSTGTPSASPSLAGLSTKIKLPTSLSWLLADALQQQQPSSQLPASPEPARAIKLHGCQVRRHEASVAKPSGLDAATGGEGIEVRHQIQILVPNARNKSSVNQFPGAIPRTGPLGNTTPSFSQVSYSIYTFEVSDSDGSEQECDAWVAALDRVCMFHLYMLERSIRDVQSLSQYRQVLSSHLPLCISLSWLRNRIDRHDTLQGGGQQQQIFQQHQQQQRRSSKNLSMVQIIKDLERDKILVDQKLIATTAGDDSTSSSTSHESSTSSSRSEQGNISEVVKYVVMKVMEFVRRIEQRAKDVRAATTAAGTEFNTSPVPLASAPAPSTPGLPPTSPTNRFAKYSEVRALAFVERVLRGSSRTQSGGDIYDAISFFCQHSRVSICPVSQDACPVQMNIVSDDASDVFQVEVQVCMRFKVIEMTPMTATMSASVSTTAAPSSALSPPGLISTDNSTLESLINSFSDNTRHSIADHSILEGPKVWAVLEGTLTRQFTLGKLSEPGAVTIDVIPLDNGDTSSS